MAGEAYVLGFTGFAGRSILHAVMAFVALVLFFVASLGFDPRIEIEQDNNKNEIEIELENLQNTTILPENDAENQNFANKKLSYLALNHQKSVGVSGCSMTYLVSDQVASSTNRQISKYSLKKSISHLAT